MIEFSFAGKIYQACRVIGNLSGSDTGPIVVFVGGIHGNEPSGVIALQQVFDRLRVHESKLQGQFIGIAGNLAALAQNRRFISKDLNRIWDNDFSRRHEGPSDHYNGQTNGQASEHIEQREIFAIIEPFLRQNRPVFFVDLHTTSGQSVPFIAINDQLANRNFAIQFPVPTVLGIEEYLEGPLLSYLNGFGHVALAFEAGQHDDPSSITSHVSFICLALQAAGVATSEQIPDLDEHRERLESAARIDRGFFEVIFRKPITDKDGFTMNPGYRNFMLVKKGELLARDRNGEINSQRPGRIFMPLYQPVGNDGFFLVRKIPKWALRLSAVLRKANFDTFLTWLPGISRAQDQSDALVVNKTIARYLATELLHLLGYRRKKDKGHVMIFSRREIN